MFTSLFILVFLYILFRIITHIFYTQKMSNLKSRYILITGCDSGFGNAAAKQLDGMGCHVIAACLTEKGEIDLKQSCTANLITVHMDVADHESVVKAYDTISGILPKATGLWGLVNNAGVVGKPVPSDWQDVQEHRRVTDVNLFGLIDVTKTFLPLIKQSKGRIVNTASIVGRVAVASSAYCVSKYGIEAFSDCLRREMLPFKVSVHIVEPGFFKTNMSKFDDLEEAKIWKSFQDLPSAMKNDYGEQFTADFVASSRAAADSGYASEDLSLVVDAYVHALTAKYPLRRYTVGPLINILLIIQALPEWLGDWVLDQLKGKNSPVPAACK